MSIRKLQVLSTDTDRELRTLKQWKAGAAKHGYKALKQVSPGKSEVWEAQHTNGHGAGKFDSRNPDKNYLLHPNNRKFNSKAEMIPVLTVLTRVPNLAAVRQKGEQFTWKFSELDRNIESLKSGDLCEDKRVHIIDRGYFTAAGLLLTIHQNLEGRLSIITLNMDDTNLLKKALR